MTIRNMADKENTIPINPIEALELLKRNKWTILGCVLFFVTITALITRMLPPIFEAKATIVIDRKQSTPQLINQRTDYESHISEVLTFKTHFKLITSRPVVENVISELKLDLLGDSGRTDMNIFARFKDRFVSNMKLLMGVSPKPLTPVEKHNKLIQAVRKKYKIREIKDTRLLQINAMNRDPAMARDMANALAQGYIDFDIQNRVDVSQDMIGWLGDKILKVKTRLEQAEQAFLGYKQQEKLISIEENQKITAQKLREFNDAYIKARNQRVELDTKLAQLKRISSSRKEIPNLRSLIDSKFIDKLYLELVEADLEKSRLAKVYKLKHPKMTQIQAKIENSRKKLQAEIDKELRSIEAGRNVLLAKERILRKTMDDFSDEAMESNRKELQYNILKRDLEANQQLYDTLISKLKETDITGNIQFSNLRIAEQAVLPVKPKWPKKRLNYLLALLGGLIIGTVISFLSEFIDRTIRSEEDIQKYLELPVLSVVPTADKKLPKRMSLKE